MGFHAGFFCWNFYRGVPPVRNLPENIDAERKGKCANLGGGNSNIFYFHPYLGKSSNLTNIFQMGLKPPASKIIQDFVGERVN